VIALISYLAGLAALGFGVAVVATRRSVHTVVSLIGNILSLAVLFLTYQAQFMAFVEVAVYAGAILILFLFVIALLAAGKEEERDEYGPELAGQVAGAVGAAALTAAALLLALRVHAPRAAAAVAHLPKGYGTVQQVGAGLFGSYLLPFELTAPVLLAAIVGVVILARPHREGGEERA
jgi:NADH-quinone oxidoreductase subunit J